VKLFTFCLNCAVFFRLYGPLDLCAQHLALETVRRGRAAGIGEVADATADSNFIYILEPKRAHVVFFNYALGRVGTFGSFGSSVGQFRRPIDVSTIGGEVAVLDQALGRITTFRVSKNTQPVPTQTIQLQVPAQGMCVPAKDQFLIYGYRGGFRLHLVDVRGRLIRSFAPATLAVHRSHQAEFVKGRIYCSQDGKTVILSSSLLPHVEEFNIKTGKKIWESSLRPFREIGIRQSAKAMTFTAGRGGHNEVYQAFAIPQYLVFQTVFAGKMDHPQIDTVTTYVYSVERNDWMRASVDYGPLFPVRRDYVLIVPRVVNANREFTLSRLRIVD
jgi:hypothetical protein